MSATVEVRAATVADHASLVRLLAPAAGGSSEMAARAVELALAPRAQAWLVIALRGGMPVGVLLANPAVSAARGGGVLRVEAVEVAPLQRRKGVGRALVAHVIAEARLSGMTVIELLLPTGDAQAAGFARALAFGDGGWRLVDQPT